MAFDTTGLQGWPSPAQLTAGADAVRGAGPELENAIADASAQWNGLQGIYQAPEAEVAYGVFANITPHGGFVSSACEQVAKALQEFSDGIAHLETARTQVLADIAAHNAFVNSDSFGEEQQDMADLGRDTLQGTVNQLAAEFVWLEENCVSALSDTTGETNPFFSFMATQFAGVMFNVMDTALGGVRFRTSQHPAGPGAYYDIRPERNDFLYDRSQRYKDYVDNSNKFHVPHEEGLGGKAVKGGGWVLTVGGAYFTYQDQEQEAYNDLLASNPEMTEEERRAEASKIAGFRTGASVVGGLGAGAIGAGVGSFAGPAGTVVGFIVGSAVGWAMEQPLDVLGGKTVTEWAGDGIREGWDYLSGPGLDQAQQAAEALAEQAEEAAENAYKAAEEAAEKAQKALEDAKETVDRAVDDAKENVGKAVEDAKENVEKTIDGVKDRVFGWMG